MVEKEDKRVKLIEDTVEEILEEACQHIDTDLAGPGTGHGFFDGVKEPLYETLESFIEKHNQIQ